MALLATASAAALWNLAPASFAALDHAAYDFWLNHRSPLPAGSSLVIVAPDPTGDEMFGSGSWDRAVLARLIAAVDEAGAEAIGLDHRLDQPSPAQLGGAASDALLLDTIKSTPNLVLTQSAADTPLLSDSVRVGQLLVTTDADRIVRAVPGGGSESAAVPPFGLLLYQLVRKETALSPAETQPVLVNYAGNGSLSALPTLPISAVWAAIEGHDTDQLTDWFQHKAVVILPNQAASPQFVLPTGQTVSDATVHLHALNMLLGENRIGTAGATSRMLVSLAVTGLVAWLLLRMRSAGAWLLAAGAILAYGMAALGTLAAAHLVLPLALPISGSLLVMMTTAAWNHLTDQQRLRLMERDMLRLQQEAAAVREALVLRETRAETLQDDLNAARTAVTQSADQQHELTKAVELLRGQLADVQTQEEDARRQLSVLERQLHDLHAAATEPSVLGDSELDRLRDECRQLGIITEDAGLLRLYRDLKKGARSSLTVLLLGEPGTGKELFARAVHRLSLRSGKTFIAVNMAAVSPELFESELFGHTKGSFTGATAERRGYFELANQGTIFLDEIGDLRLDHQSKLLRVLQEKSFYRVGATVPTTVDVRIVAATNRDLQRGVSEGWFREDLYFRLSGLTFRLPPLRERTGDIPLLTERLLADIAAEMGRPAPRLSNDAMQLLEAQEWKGNVRELRHCLERAVALNDTLLLGKEALRLGGHRLAASARPKDSPLLPEPAGDAAVLACLRQHDFDMQASAKALGWDRSTVTQRLKGLCFQALVEANGDQAKAAFAIAGDAGHLRTVELKLMDYHGHLLSVIAPFDSVEDALVECKRRFKNLPERHFASVEALVRRHFGKRAAG
jgi:transcriptional regulator with PAS, ATPase and Fis domain/CHASE2 domain-containing sensor protein